VYEVRGRTRRTGSAAGSRLPPPCQPAWNTLVAVQKPAIAPGVEVTVRPRRFAGAEARKPRLTVLGRISHAVTRAGTFWNRGAPNEPVTPDRHSMPDPASATVRADNFSSQVARRPQRSGPGVLVPVPERNHRCASKAARYREPSSLITKFWPAAQARYRPRIRPPPQGSRTSAGVKGDQPGRPRAGPRRQSGPGGATFATAPLCIPLT